MAIENRMITGIEAGLSEARGAGRFQLNGRKIEFRDNQDKLVATWYARTSKDAAQQIRIFRAAPKNIEEQKYRNWLEDIDVGFEQRS